VPRSSPSPWRWVKPSGNRSMGINPRPSCSHVQNTSPPGVSNILCMEGYPEARDRPTFPTATRAKGVREASQDGARTATSLVIK
jgi:hypothetical protein